MLFTITLAAICILIWKADGVVMQQVAVIAFKLIVTFCCIFLVFIYCFYHPLSNNMTDAHSYKEIDDRHVGGDAYP